MIKIATKETRADEPTETKIVSLKKVEFGNGPCTKKVAPTRVL